MKPMAVAKIPNTCRFINANLGRATVTATLWEHTAEPITTLEMDTCIIDVSSLNKPCLDIPH